MTLPRLFRYLTSTVGLVTVRYELGVNVMAAEWTYFVAKEPLHVAIGLGDGGLTQSLVAQAGEFGVTLCSSAQAGVANFVGSFSGADVDKTASDALAFRPSVAISTPCVDGGVLTAECRVVDTVDLPGYKLFVGEALAVDVDDVASMDPLVKHGAMYRLGDAIADDTIVVAAELVDDAVPTLRVAAAVQAGVAGDAPWRVSLVAPDGTRTLLGEARSTEYGDMFEDFVLAEPRCGAPLAACRVLVERSDARPGWASVSQRRIAGATRDDDDELGAALRGEPRPTSVGPAVVDERR